MKLCEYDNKLVRIEDIDGNVFEGYCQHYSPDYNYHEYAIDEEALRIEFFIFFKRDIKKVELIDDFSGPYGTLEKMTAESGIDGIDEALTSEDATHICRMLTYLDSHLEEIGLDDFKDKLIKLLQDLIKYFEDDNVVNKSEDLLEKIKSHN